METFIDPLRLPPHPPLNGKREKERKLGGSGWYSFMFVRSKQVSFLYMIMNGILCKNPPFFLKREKKEGCEDIFSFKGEPSFFSSSSHDASFFTLLSDLRPWWWFNGISRPLKTEIELETSCWLTFSNLQMKKKMFCWSTSRKTVLWTLLDEWVILKNLCYCLHSCLSVDYKSRR